MRTVTETLRKIARDYERGIQCGRYSCNAVLMELGGQVAKAYAEAFELYCVNASELWSMEPAQRDDLRVMLLCFAAAMAETGDL